VAKAKRPPSAKAPTSRRKIGGPPKREPKLGERVALSLRMTPELKRQLDFAAEQGGRSQSQEAEFRLERSFDRSDLLPEVLSLAFGGRTAGLLLAIGIAMQGAAATTMFIKNRKPDEDWTSDPDAYREAGQAADLLFRLGKPAGKWSAGYGTGSAYAESIVSALAKRDEPSTILDDAVPHADAVLALLGPIATRMTDELPRWEELTREVDESRKRGKQLSENMKTLRENVAGGSGPVRDASLGELANWAVELVVREAGEFANLQDSVAFVREVGLRLEHLLENDLPQKKAS
jgi:hypothetical protein